MIIKPYSHAATEQFISADFPCVKHFFKCDEAAGSLSIVDSVAGVTFTQQGGNTISKPDNYSIKYSTGASCAATGTWSTAGTKHWVCFAVLNSASVSNFSVGASTGSYVNLKTTAPGFSQVTLGAAANASDFPNTADSSGSAVRGRAMVLSAYNATDGVLTYELGKTSYATAIAAGATPVSDTNASSSGGVAITGMDALTMGAAGFVTAPAAVVIYGIAWFEFTTLPSDLLVGLSWMTNEWQNGNKAIYPGWKGRT